MSNFSLLFYAKKTKSSPEFSVIYLRISINGKRSEISTGQKIHSSLWCPKTSKIKGNSALSKTTNSILDNVKLKVLSHYNELLMANKEMTHGNTQK